MVAKKNNNTESGGLKLFEWAMLFKEKYGILNIISTGLLILFMSFVITLAMNPSIIFDRYRAYEEMKHEQSFNYRMKTNKAISLNLHNFVQETGGSRCFIIEMHNGKHNSTGLSFNYGAMTYEAVANDSTLSIAEDFTEFTLDRYEILMKVYDEGFWCGTIEELKNIDKRMALKLEANGSYGIAISCIYGINSKIGFMGITYKEPPVNCDKIVMSNLMQKYCASVSPFLDGDRLK